MASHGILLIAGFLMLCGLGACVSSSHVKREDIEWCNIWLPAAKKTDLPQVLLIGDSITQAYYDKVAEHLKGKAYVSRMTTSKSLGDPSLLDEVAYVLRQQKFDIVHFNNGLHGFDYTEAEYIADFPALIKTLRKGAPQAKLMWATTTPVRVANDLEKVDEQRTERVKVRNAQTLAIIQKEKIPTNDLFLLVQDHPDYYFHDGIHFNETGISAEAQLVANGIEELLK